SAAGEGSTFFFNLILSRAPAADKSGDEPASSTAPGRLARVLVAERSAAQRQMMVGMLEQWGLACQTAADLETTTLLLDRAVPGFDLLILDPRLIAAAQAVD